MNQFNIIKIYTIFRQQQDTNSIQVPIDYKLGDTGTYPGNFSSSSYPSLSLSFCYLIVADKIAEIILLMQIKDHRKMAVSWALGILCFLQTIFSELFCYCGCLHKRIHPGSMANSIILTKSSDSFLQIGSPQIRHLSQTHWSMF